MSTRPTAEHPGEVAGLVLVDGGFPVSLLSEEDRQRARRSFRRMGPAMRMLAALGRSAKTTRSEFTNLGPLLRSITMTTLDKTFSAVLQRSQITVHLDERIPPAPRTRSPQ